MELRRYLYISLIVMVLVAFCIVPVSSKALDVGTKYYEQKNPSDRGAYLWCGEKTFLITTDDGNNANNKVYRITIKMYRDTIRTPGIISIPVQEYRFRSLDVQEMTNPFMGISRQPIGNPIVYMYNKNTCKVEMWNGQPDQSGSKKLMEYNYNKAGEVLHLHECNKFMDDVFSKIPDMYKPINTDVKANELKQNINYEVMKFKEINKNEGGTWVMKIAAVLEPYTGFNIDTIQKNANEKIGNCERTLNVLWTYKTRLEELTRFCGNDDKVKVISVGVTLASHLNGIAGEVFGCVSSAFTVVNFGIVLDKGALYLRALDAYSYAKEEHTKLPEECKIKC